jgi:hypothetical protein
MLHRGSTSKEVEDERNSFALQEYFDERATFFECHKFLHLHFVTYSLARLLLFSSPFRLLSLAPLPYHVRLNLLVFAVLRVDVGWWKLEPK